MDYIDIKGYKSIKDLHLELKPINVLIGANGAGKSNFLSFFELLNRLYNKKLNTYINLRGGADKILHKGSKVTSKIYGKIKFAPNGYSFEIENGDEGFIFTKEDVWYDGNPHFPDPADICSYGSEANIKYRNVPVRVKYIQAYLNSFMKYHFHDTGSNSSFTNLSHIENDIHFLYEKGENLAAFLYNIRQTQPIIYKRIIETIQSVAPFFSDFYLEPNEEKLVRLQWQDQYASTIYGATDFSDGTMRFIALAALFLQPNPPSVIIIDEPELGLHPFAIDKLSGLIQSVANRKIQTIISTQSVELVNCFTPEDIITVDSINGESKFERLDSSKLSVWMDDYAVGDMWRQNILSKGFPNK